MIEIINSKDQPAYNCAPQPVVQITHQFREYQLEKLLRIAASTLGVGRVCEIIGITPNQHDQTKSNRKEIDMTKPNTIKIDDTTYVREDMATPSDTALKIVVLDRGFVYIGWVRIEDDFVVIHNAQNIRVWGTTEGLGQLAIKGPTKNTVLDTTGTVRAPMRALIALVDVAEDKWPSFR